MSTYEIRKPERPEEWICIQQLLRAFQEEFDYDECFTSFEEEMGDIEKLYAKPGYVKLVAVHPSSPGVAGCVALRLLSPDIAEMKRLYVDPAHRGRGVGLALAKAILVRGREMGVRQMVLDTSFAMQEAIALYRSLGFALIAPYNRQDPARVLCLGIDLQPHRS